MIEKITDISANIWINANAGSGKTTAIVNRFLSLLLNGIPHWKILCITYTNNAADEMKSRILAKLKSWDNSGITKKDLQNLGFDEKYLAKATMLFDEIQNNENDFKIGTIHGFCYEILKKYSPNYTILENKIISENDIEKISLTIKQELCGQTNFFEFSEEERKKIHQNIRIICKNASSYYFEKLINYSIKNYNRIFHFMEGINEEISNLLNLDKNEIKMKFQNEIKSLNFNAICIIFSEKFPTKQLQIDELKSLKFDDIFFQNLYEICFTKDEKIRSILSKINDENLRYFLQILEDFYIINQKINYAELTQSSFEIIIYCLKIYEIIKQKQNLISYEDMIFDTLNLLKNPENSWILYNLDSSLSHILLDEAQDTNQQSWEIIEKISEEFFTGFGINQNLRTIFAVGDIKQSIFAFQGANPELFECYKNIFKKKSQNVKMKFQEINLENSYRSSQIILDFIDKISNNFLFDNQKIKHYSKIENQSGTIKIENLRKQKFSEEENFNWLSKIDDKNEILIKKIQDEIKNFNKIGIENNEILILFQNRSSGSGIIYNLISEFEKLQIKYDIISNLGRDLYLLDIITFLQFLHNKNDNFSLGCILKSNIFHFNDNDLIDIICTNNEIPKINYILYEKLLQYQSEDKKILNAQKFIQYIIDFIDQNEQNFLQNLILVKEIVNFSDNSEIYSHYLDEILKLYYREFSINNEISIKEFLDILEKDSSIISLKKENSGIKIGTIHSAKGLENKAIILLDLSTKKTAIQNDPVIIFDNKLWCRVNLKLFDKMKDFLEFESNLEKQEINRLLYVALTRAKSHISIISEENGTWNNIFKNYEKIQS